jgi:oxepin-CoA hydrolase/3-oxo-5,6-dehydrosuberyl-CoA semialdehyde dehydrogenase
VEVDNYYNYFNENPDAVLMNPTFGELNKDEWEQFHKKHLTHHLTQFGLIE